MPTRRTLLEHRALQTLVAPPIADVIRPNKPQPHTLTPAASFLLDLVRLTAALLVVASHIGHPEFATGLPNHQILGDLAVPVFFVLSGFVIRFVTLSREHTLRVFLIDRAARMYSVILPAMALTLVLTFLCSRIAPAYYQHWFAPFSDHPLTRILLNLTFLSQSWSHSTIPFINSPFWSLSYECLYYLAYGLFFYLRGAKRIIALVLWAAIAGPQVLFLLPVWALGCVLYDLFQAVRATRAAYVLRRATLLYLAAAALLFALGHPILAQAPLHANFAFSQLRNPLTLLHLNPYRASMLALATGCLAAVFMLLLLLLADLTPLKKKNVWVRRFRHLADGTFAIYLMHYPLMVLANSLGLFRPAHPVQSITVTIAICLLLILLSPLLDLFKLAIRSTLHHLLTLSLFSAKPEPSACPNSDSSTI